MDGGIASGHLDVGSGGGRGSGGGGQLSSRQRRGNQGARRTASRQIGAQAAAAQKGTFVCFVRNAMVNKTKNDVVGEERRR